MSESGYARPRRSVCVCGGVHTGAVAQGYPEGWSIAAGALEREFRFGDFAEAIAFVNRVADLAEAENHHPDIAIHWNTVVLRFWTHSQNAITDRDRELAALAGALA